ncbi:discoidin domain-containing protein [Vitiosangium sp. GDMCC 1.1324]|uniref:discoidin domain-containing protein n=1 Tax=Vitiosangium sp. (strain GDMCC 1.1324) TaxID=2138576 RepID=UPI0011B6FE92|nr:discoidin domain-containing protein [Vitiosangium sp. GDMCC 1.1324]
MKRSWSSVGTLMLGAGLMAGCGAVEEGAGGARTPLAQVEQGLGVESVGWGDTLTLAANGSYELYVDGALVGRDARWLEAGTYSAQVNAGDVVAVRVERGVGSTWSGLLADIKVDGRLVLSTERLSWRCTSTYTPGWETVDFKDDAWPAAVERTTNWGSPWGPVAGIGSATKWIGLADSAAVTFYCRATVLGCGPDEARGKPASSSGSGGSDTPDKAFDGDVNTRWTSSASTGSWVQVDLGRQTLIGRAAAIWGWDTRFGTSASSVLEGSTDGVVWKQLADFSQPSSTIGTRLFRPIFPRAAVRYVRMRGTQWNGATGFVNDLQLFFPCSQCGEDQALKRRVTTSGSSNGTTAELAVDGDPTTSWESDRANDGWVQVDLGQPLNIEQVDVKWGWDISGQVGTTASSVIKYSTDGLTYQTLETLTHDTETSGDPQTILKPFSARYVLFQGLNWNNRWGYLDDLKVIGSCQTCGTNLALGKPVTASSSWSSEYPSLAVDGLFNTYWGAGMSTGAWLEVDLGQEYPVAYALVAWNWDANIGDDAESVLEGRSTTGTWMPLGNLRHTDATNWRKQGLFFLPETVRYVRFRATRWNTGWGNVSELQVCTL